jgi:drug/metabolite transporter (DMT)-like permease
MKAVSFAIIAIVLYAVQNALIELFLRKYSAVGILVISYIVMLPLCLGSILVMRATGQEITYPVGKDLWILVAVATMFFAADFLYVKAYTVGASALVVTTCLVLMPVVATAFKAIWVREAPSVYQVGAFVCAAAAVTMIALGERNKSKNEKAAGEPQTKSLQAKPSH